MTPWTLRTLNIQVHRLSYSAEKEVLVWPNTRKRATTSCRYLLCLEKTWIKPMVLLSPKLGAAPHQQNKEVPSTNFGEPLCSSCIGNALGHCSGYHVSSLIEIVRCSSHFWTRICWDVLVQSVDWKESRTCKIGRNSRRNESGPSWCWTQYPIAAGAAGDAIHFCTVDFGLSFAITFVHVYPHASNSYHRCAWWDPKTSPIGPLNFYSSWRANPSRNALTRWVWSFSAFAFLHKILWRIIQSATWQSLPQYAANLQLEHWGKVDPSSVSVLRHRRASHLRYPNRRGPYLISEKCTTRGQAPALPIPPLREGYWNDPIGWNSRKEKWGYRTSSRGDTERICAWSLPSSLDFEHAVPTDQSLIAWDQGQASSFKIWPCQTCRGWELASFSG